MKQNGFAQVIVVVLLVVGVLFGTTLVSQRTNFLPKANEDNKSSRTTNSKKTKTNEIKKTSMGQKIVQNQKGDNNFIFEFDNPNDVKLWTIRKIPEYNNLYLDDFRSTDKDKNYGPEESGITDFRIEDGYLKFKKLNDGLNYIRGPQNLHIEVEKLRQGGYSESKSGIFRARGKIGNDVPGKQDTSGVTFNIHYFDDENPYDAYLMYPFPILTKKKGQFSKISYEMLKLDEGFKRFPEETNKFLGPNTYIRGYSLTVGGYAGQEIWIDYFGFYDKFPERPEKGDKIWNAFPGF